MKRPIVIIAVLMLLLSTAFAQDDDAVITVDSSEVVVNIAVFDRSGRHVPGLRREQFKIFEDGVEQSLTFFAAEQTPFAAVILMDTSGSMESRVSLARSAVIAFLDGMRKDDNSAVYRFDSKVHLIRDFAGSRDLPDRFFDLKADGMTVLNDAVFEAASLLAQRPEKRRAIIVLSDGADNMSKRSAGKALNAALAANATIYTIDMSERAVTGGGRSVQNVGVLKNFAEKTGGFFIAAPGGVAMREGFKRIVDELGVQYTAAYQPAETRKDGKWRPIEVRIAKPNLTIRTRKGYISAKR